MLADGGLQCAGSVTVEHEPGALPLSVEPIEEGIDHGQRIVAA